MHPAERMKTMYAALHRGFTQDVLLRGPSQVDLCRPDELANNSVSLKQKGGKQMSNNPKRKTRSKAKPEQQVDSEECCGSVTPAASCCKLQSLVSVDERGQMILPKEIRDKAGISAGDKLALTSLEKDGKICCMILTRADELAGGVKIMLGAVVKDLGQDQE